MKILALAAVILTVAVSLPVSAQNKYIFKAETAVAPATKAGDSAQAEQETRSPAVATDEAAADAAATGEAATDAATGEDATDAAGEAATDAATGEAAADAAETEEGELE